MLLFFVTAVVVVIVTLHCWFGLVNFDATVAILATVIDASTAIFVANSCRVLLLLLFL